MFIHEHLIYEHLFSFELKEFQRRYRVTLEMFNMILERIRMKLCVSLSIGNLRVNNGAIDSELKLSVTLRWLAGQVFFFATREGLSSNSRIFFKQVDRTWIFPTTMATVEHRYILLYERSSMQSTLHFNWTFYTTSWR